jgi:hypothetical protein
MLSPYIFFNSIYYNLNVTKESIDILESFPEYLEPLKATLQYEIFYLNKKTEEAKNYRDLIYSKYPGEIWRLKDIEKGTGIISYLMRMGKLK